MEPFEADRSQRLAGTSPPWPAAQRAGLTNHVNDIEFSYNEAGWLTSAADFYSAFGFTHDALGRVTEETQTLAGLTPQITLNKSYDAANRRLTLSASVGTTADFENSYTHDALGRTTQLVQQGQSGGNAVAEKLVDFSYNAVGQFTTLDRYQSADTSEFVATTSFGYDGLGRLSSLLHSQDTVTLAGYDYSYDPPQPHHRDRFIRRRAVGILLRRHQPAYRRRPCQPGERSPCLRCQRQPQR